MEQSTYHASAHCASSVFASSKKNVVPSLPDAGDSALHEYARLVAFRPPVVDSAFRSSVECQ